MTQRIALLLLISSCNQAPVDYRDLGSAPGRSGNWMGPDEWCRGRRFQSDTDQVVDGYLLCTDSIRVKPIDDPEFVPCDHARSNILAPQDEVVFVYDGELAKAYSLAELHLREGVHDMLRGVPVFVDF